MQGNKRTAFLAAVLFLERNGYMTTVPDSEDLAASIIAVIDKKQKIDKFREYLEPFVRPAP